MTNDETEVFTGPRLTLEAADKAKKRQREAASVRGECHTMQDGERTMQVDAEAYHAALNANRRDFNTQENCWDDPEFCSDMKKRHPDIVVKAHSRNASTGYRGSPKPAPRKGSTFFKSYG